MALGDSRTVLEAIWEYSAFMLTAVMSRQGARGYTRTLLSFVFVMKAQADSHGLILAFMEEYFLMDLYSQPCSDVCGRLSVPSGPI